MNKEDAEEYTRSLGQIVAGSWRQIALAKRLGVPKALGLETRQWVEERLGGYVKISMTERNDAALELSNSGHGVRDIGEILGISKSSAANAVQSWTESDPIDAVAGLAADDAMRRAIKREEESAQKAEKRAERERELGAKQIALPNKRYGVIYADPEWRFETYSEKGKDATSADNHYPTSPIEEIKSRDVPSISAEDCSLFLWATVPMLPQALQVMDAWGFKYKTNWAWVKDRTGTGYWNLNQHELLLLGTRGKVPAPVQGTQGASVVNAPRREHSRKPDEFYQLIERFFPNLPKIELNARQKREGWDAWGYEVPV